MESVVFEIGVMVVNSKSDVFEFGIGSNIGVLVKRLYFFVDLLSIGVVIGS